MHTPAAGKSFDPEGIHPDVALALIEEALDLPCLSVGVEAEVADSVKKYEN